jgi:glycosyltransferase involved in cell wall biosynthesis
VRIAWVGPLPPTPSGIGDYSADLLPHVAALVAVEAFTSEPGWAPDSPVPGLTVRPWQELPEALAADPELVAVYHQGNNEFHWFVHDLAMHQPGVLALHDVVQHHGVLDRAGRSGDWRPFREALVEQYGADRRDLAALRRAGIGGDLEKFLFPLSGPLIRRSLVTVVHSRYARDMARRECPTAVFHVIPHHSGVPPESVPLTPAEVRARLGVAPSTLLVGSFGYITIPKQGDVLLHGMAELLADGADAAVVFVGSDERRGELMDRAEDLGIGERVRFSGYLDRPEFYAYLAAVDVVVSLRYPSAGETSGTLSRALSLGKCLIVADYANFAELPDEACIHIPVYHNPGHDPGPELARALRRLIDRPSQRRVLGEGARNLALGELSLSRCARLYVEAAANAMYLAA